MDLPEDYQDRKQLVVILSDKWKRLNSLYWIIDKEGKRVRFRLNVDQQRLFESLWYMNLILKDRQRGFTTVIGLYILDECLFNDNVEGGIIGHNLDDTKKIFRRKIKYPYDNLPEWVRASRPSITDRVDELAFPNNSTIYVSTSMRSGTLQYLHLSEFGKVCAKFPEKAKEIVSGSFEAVKPGQIIWVESTAEGKEGAFYEYCQEAQRVEQSGRPLTMLDFKFFFYGWPDDPEKVLDGPYPLTEADNKYFRGLESKIGKKLSDRQKYWWAAKNKILREDMKKENPGTPEEAFEAAVEGAYYSTEFVEAREEGRITSVPHVKGIPVDSWWDLGYTDSTSIWFSQTVGREIHIIGYYENQGEGLLHYAIEIYRMAKDNEWIMGRHTGPFDTMKHELGSGKTIFEQAKDLVDTTSGERYPLIFDVATRIEHQQQGIEAVRRIFPFCWFDEEKTTTSIKTGGKDRAVGVPSLESYRKEYDENKETFRNIPLHNWASHGAKAFETMAISHSFRDLSKKGKLKRMFG